MMPRPEIPVKWIQDQVDHLLKYVDQVPDGPMKETVKVRASNYLDLLEAWVGHGDSQTKAGGG